MTRAKKYTCPYPGDYTYDEIVTLVYGWSVHPRFISPARNSLRYREKADGEMWLKEEELESFERYAGVEFRQYL